MADIMIVCGDCNKTFPVSEFADPAQISCPSCGKPIGQAAIPPSGRSDTPLQLKKNYTETWKAAQKAKAAQQEENNVAAKAAGTSSQGELMKGAFGPKRNLASSHRFGPDRRQVLLAWLVFAFTGALFYWLRYGGTLPTPWFDYLRNYGWTLVALVALITLTAAFAEGLMQGVLCVLVPGYFLYFLLLSDRIYLRAVSYGLLFGVGPDTWILIRKTWLQFYENAMAWILSGGA